LISLIKAKKSLGQNFLTDSGVARRIIEAVAPLPTDIVVEIGPGTGALTQVLLDRSGYVVAVEIDQRLVDGLRNKLKGEHLTIVNTDALRVDWRALIAEATSSFRAVRGSKSGDSRVRVVANLPYYISTPIMERLLSFGRLLFDMTLMLQKEVADRIATGAGSKEYGYLSVVVQYYSEATKLFEVAPSAFTPAPKVRSAVIRLTLRGHPAVDVADEKRFFAFVRAAFAQRRKTILNNLKAASRSLEFTQAVEPALEAASVSPQRRAETLSLAEFAALYRTLYDA